MAELLVRTAWALGIGFFGFCAYWAISALVLRRLRKPASGLEELHPGMPAILILHHAELPTLQDPTATGFEKAFRRLRSPSESNSDRCNPATRLSGLLGRAQCADDFHH